MSTWAKFDLVSRSVKVLNGEGPRIRVTRVAHVHDRRDHVVFHLRCVGWHGVGWCGMAWDGVGWREMAWDGVGWRGMACYRAVRSGSSLSALISAGDLVVPQCEPAWRARALSWCISSVDPFPYTRIP